MKIILRIDAEHDLLDIFNYSKDVFGTIIAQKYISDLRKRIQGIVDNPRIGRVYPLISSELLCLNHSHHLIFYRIKGEDIIILRILHSSRDITNLFEEN